MLYRPLLCAPFAGALIAHQYDAGMDEDRRARMQARITAEAALPYCAPDELDMALTWQMGEDGSLRGDVTVRNRGTRTCRVGGKPIVTPLARDGSPLRAQTIVTLESRMPSWVVLSPGARALASVGWSGWCGAPASGRARIEWERGDTTVTADGPRQPRCPDGGQPVNLWSSWFRALDETGADAGVMQ
jgi:hypothetical protein